jgi:protein involved in polysaccharide export with SLBB domain
MWLALVLVASGSGCASMQYCCDLPAVPAHRLPPELLGRPRADTQLISISRLRQDAPDVYLLGPGDVLGIYIPDVLGKDEDPPPVHFPERGDQPPALGYPVPIRDDGTVALPIIPPVEVAGLSLPEASDKILADYIDAKILKEGQAKIILTLLRRRMYRVAVIREEGGGKEGVTKRGTGQTIDLPAYENDVLHALNETGGLPGLDARNEIYILRGTSKDGERRDALIAQLSASRGPCDCPCPEPDDPSVVRIPIRFHPEGLPQFEQRDIILSTGDIVYIPARDNEKFYTGGALGGGEFLIPRDYDLDVLGAIAIARGPLGSSGTGISRVGNPIGGGFGAGNAGGGVISPSLLIVVRKLPCGGQVPIEVDINRALVDPSHRILVQPEDMLVLRYRLQEEVINAALGIFQVNYFLNSLNN